MLISIQLIRFMDICFVNNLLFLQKYISGINVGIPLKTLFRRGNVFILIVLIISYKFNNILIYPLTSKSTYTKSFSIFISILEVLLEITCSSI